MAKNSKKGTTALNPGFDNRMLSIGSPNNAGKALRRGWIATDNSVLPSGSLAGRVNFLFNPPQVQVSHPLNSSYASADYQTALTDAESGGQAEWVANTLGQSGEVGLSLLFDRTYELWDRKYKGTLQGDYGAYVDVLAFYKLLGIVDSATSPLVGPIAPGTNRPNITNFGLFPQNPLRGTPICYLYLGPNSLKFRGFVDNLNVTYTHFSRGMVPMRVQVDISLQMYMADITGDTMGGGSITNPSSSLGLFGWDGTWTTNPPSHPGVDAPGTDAGPRANFTDPNTGQKWSQR